MGRLDKGMGLNNFWVLLAEGEASAKASCLALKVRRRGTWLISWDTQKLILYIFFCVRCNEKHIGSNGGRRWRKGLL